MGKEQIEINKKNGLLCACNLVLVPYYDERGKEHGSLVQDNVLHGYNDCKQLENEQR
jgi:hypothetical protein